MYIPFSHIYVYTYVRTYTLVVVSLLLSLFSYPKTKSIFWQGIIINNPPHTLCVYVFPLIVIVHLEKI